MMKSLTAAVLLLGATTWAQDGRGGGTNYGEDRCAVYPDPHFHTFDGNYFDFHLPCDYTLVTNPDLTLQVRTARPAGASWSLVSGFAIKTGGNVLSFEAPTATAAGVILYNGAPVTATNMPGALPHTSGPIAVTPDTSNGFWFNFATGDSIHISTFNGSGNIQINSIGAHGVFARSRGLCGAYDGNQAYDYVDPNGILTPIWSPQADIDSWGLSWTATPSLFGTPAQCDSTPVLHERPQDPDLERQAAAVCKHALPDTELFKDCVEDVLLTGDVTWAENPVYAKPMRCLQGCECDKHHPDAKCLDRCLLGHDCFKACPTRGCVCNVPKPVDRLCEAEKTAEMISFGASPMVPLMCYDRGCHNQGGRCRSERNRCFCDQSQECPKDAKVCPDGTVLHRDWANDCQFPRCPGDYQCPDDIKKCRDGTVLVREGPDCQFPACPHTYDHYDQLDQVTGSYGTAGLTVGADLTAGTFGSRNRG